MRYQLWRHKRKQHVQGQVAWEVGHKIELIVSSLPSHAVTPLTLPIKEQAMEVKYSIL